MLPEQENNLFDRLFVNKIRCISPGNVQQLIRRFVCLQLKLASGYQQIAEKQKVKMLRNFTYAVT